MTSPVDLILTAANRAQARGYAMQVRQRQRDERLPGTQRVLVSPDPGDRRVGSGTATLNALAALVTRIRRERRDAKITIHDALVNRQVFVIHSGGDSRRLPAYAAQGKIFASLPTSPDSMQSPALFDAIVRDLTSIGFPESGGVIVAAGDVLLGVAKHRLRFDDDAVTVVVSPGSIERASRHGVFVADVSGNAVIALQKPDEAALRSRGAIDAAGHILIDLGLAFIPIRIASRWLQQAQASGLLDSEPPTLDLYADVLPALASNRAPLRTSDARAVSWLNMIAGEPLRVRSVADSLFFHLGSSRELLEQLASADAMRSIGASVSSINNRACVIDSILESSANITARCVVDACWLEHDPTLPGDNILVGVPRECTSAAALPARTGLVCLPVDDRDWVAIAFGIDDDFKTNAAHGGTFAGRPLQVFSHAHWDSSDDHTLWSARLWAVGSASASVQHALNVLAASGDADPANLRSAAQIMPRVNHRRLMAHRGDIARERAFRSVARRVRIHVDMPAAPRAACMAKGETVRITAPVRIDLAGGWSDTPPICNDVGGCVVNVAVRLEGEHPIAAEARLIDEPLIRVRSVDLDRVIDLRDARLIGDHRDPGDWAALPKAALVVSGIAPARPDADLTSWLAATGGGIELTMHSALPKGSGLGASSILGAATLACLARVVGQSLSREQLIVRTSALEQMMSTAGGWQDQAGGISRGVKLLATAAGPSQVPLEEPLSIPTEFWRERVLLYSTGLQRLARDILQNVVWRWMRGGSEIRAIVHQLREGAARMRDDLQAGDMDAFARGMLKYWELKKAIDPGATTPMIESLIERVRPHLNAWELPGAGGGGFLFMIARDASSAHRVRSILDAQPPNTAARFFDATIDDRGLTDTAPTP